MTSKGTVSTDWTFTNEEHVELPISCSLESEEIRCSALSLTTNKAVIVEAGPQRMKTITKGSASADMTRIREEEFRGNTSSSTLGLIFPSTAFGLNITYWILIGILLGGVIITAKICKNHRLRSKSSPKTSSGGAVVCNNIQVNPAEPKFTLVPLKRNKPTFCQWSSYQSYLKLYHRMN